MIPEFVFDGGIVAGSDGVEQFQPFRFDLLFHIFVLGPREAHAVGLGVDAVGLGQGRQAAREAVIGPLGAFGGCGGLFLAFDAVPVLELLGLAAVGRIPENVRVATNHLGRLHFQRIRQRGASGAGHELADHDQQKGHVAQFLHHVRGLPGTDGVHQLVAFLNDVFGQGFRRLRAVPRAAVRRNEPVYDGVEAVERGMDGGVRRGGRKGLRGACIAHDGIPCVRCWKKGAKADIARKERDFKGRGGPILWNRSRLGDVSSESISPTFRPRDAS